MEGGGLGRGRRECVSGGRGSLLLCLLISGQCPVGARGGHQQRMASWQMYSGNPGLKLLKSGANKATSVLSNSRHGPFKGCRSLLSLALAL